MLNWYELPEAFGGMENNPEYLIKISIDREDDEKIVKKYIPKRAAKRTTNSWIEKRNHKKHMVRLFLTVNSAMDYSRICGTGCGTGIHICTPGIIDGESFDPKTSYAFNLYSHIFLSPRGDLRKYHGDIFPIRSSYALGNKDKDIPKLTNRRIRYSDNTDSTVRYSYYKKLYAPLVDTIW